MMITVIPPQYINNHKERILELIERNRKLLWPRATPGDIYSGCLDGENILWAAFNDELEIKGICISRVVTYPRCNFLEFQVTSGDDADEWLDEMNETTERFAKEIGCLGRQEMGRKGWIRKLSKYGFKESKLIFLEHIPSGQE